MHRISIIGPGRVGGALAIALSRSGNRIADLLYRNTVPSQDLVDELEQPRILNITSDFQLDVDIIIIATADPDIAEAVELLLDKIVGDPVVLHVSGSLSSDSLKRLRGLGCSVGSMHPLLSINDALVGSRSFDSAFFCIEGDAKAVAAAEHIVQSLGGRFFTIETKMKPLYHASAVMACGHLTALIETAAAMLSETGIPSSDSIGLLLPLVKSTLANIESVGPGKALTGSFARGDIGAIDRHIEAINLNGTNSELLIYLLLGERSLDIAASAGLSSEKVDIIRKRISMEKNKLRC